jgi:alpha-beta hydrolase superfamily lysophospholipase
MIPIVQWAQARSMGVLILNPNFTSDPYSARPIPKNATREAHGDYVWKHFIGKTDADLYLIAHSCGGVSVMHWMNTYWPEMKKRVKAIAFTDSVHSEARLSQEKRVFLSRKSKHWVASREPGNKLLSQAADCVPKLSAGHRWHEHTTGYAYPYIASYFEGIMRS